MTEGVAQIASTLSASLNTGSLLGILAEFLPFVIGIVGFVFIYTILRRVLKGTSKAKVRV